VISGVHLISTGNETEKLCQESPISIEEAVNELTVDYPAYSLNTYIFTIGNGSTAIHELPAKKGDRKTYYDLHGRHLNAPTGLCIEKNEDGVTKKIFIED